MSRCAGIISAHRESQVSEINGHSLYVKFNILLVGAIFISGLVMGAVLLYTTSRSLEENLDQTGTEIAVSVGSVISSQILVDDRFAITEQLLAIKNKNHHVRYIIVTKPQGDILTSTFTAGLPQGLPQQRRPIGTTEYDTITFDSNEGYIREIMYPIDDGLVGYLRIGMMENEMYELLLRRGLELFVLIFVVCTVASFFASRFAYAFLLPLQMMSEAVRRLGSGDYTVTVEPDADKDIGGLAAAFNDMTGKLRQKDAENSALLASLQAKEALRLQLINRLFTAREDERRRISGELHDEAGQSMASILAYLRVLREYIPTETGRALLANVRTVTKDTLESLRRLAVNLHPPLLDDLGLVSAMEKYMETFRSAHEELTLEFSHTGNFDNLARPVSLLCYRTLQEGLTNIVSHAHASAVSISLQRLEGTLNMTISDDGVGFNPDDAEKARLENHLGLVSMRERVALLNGTFTLNSIPKGGTTILITLPLPEEMTFGSPDHE